MVILLRIPSGLGEMGCCQCNGILKYVVIIVILYYCVSNLDVHVKVVSDSVHNIGEGWTGLFPVPLVVSNQMTVSMPQLPQLLFRNTRVVEFSQQLLIDAQVTRVTEQITHDDDISGGVLSVVPGQSWSSCDDSHGRSIVTRVEVLCVLLGSW